MIEVVAIAGVGLIGGSFALALRAAGFAGRILGISSESTCRKALERGVIDEAVTLQEGCRRAQLVYLAQPVGAILESLPLVARNAGPDCLVTDAGSTKAEICRRAQEADIPNFVGGHPMAGKELRGLEVAEAGLFAGRTYVLTPLYDHQIETGLYLDFVEYLLRFRAQPLVMQPDEHDRVVGFTSHLPQIISTALAGTLAASSLNSNDLRVAGQGLRDMTRLAVSPFEIWGDIIGTNREVLDQALAQYIDKLQFFRQNLNHPDLSKEFAVGAEFASTLRKSSES
jgi:prephenate dehydrogenase